MSFSGPPGRPQRATTRHVRGLPPKPHEQRVFYFAYADEMNPTSVKLLAPSSRYQTYGFLKDYRLLFGALPATGFDGGDTEVEHTTLVPQPDSQVLVFVYSIERGELENIDKRKRPRLYQRSSHRITLPQDPQNIGDGTGVIAITHILRPTLPPRPPSAQILQTLKRAYASVGYELKLS